ncbi:MAG TPA: RidA family protein [Stellaceae bacterium]|jgi:enamine deaminase RidA (YjgF/YER057c/UK114 family)|nr:RidA family protein [Stellaceae bacterium]
MKHRQGAHPKGKPMHKQPFPTVTRVGNVIFSSALSGTNLDTGELPKEAEKQIEHAFANVKACVEEVGGTVGDIGKMVVYLADRNMREVVNKYWVAMFPDEHDRPVRHTIGGELPGGFIIQIEFIAVAQK